MSIIQFRPREAATDITADDDIALTHVEDKYGPEYISNKPAARLTMAVDAYRESHGSMALARALTQLAREEAESIQEEAQRS